MFSKNNDNSQNKSLRWSQDSVSSIRDIRQILDVNQASFYHWVYFWQIFTKFKLEKIDATYLYTKAFLMQKFAQNFQILTRKLQICQIFTRGLSR
jgi:hypothetical protein